MHKFLSDYWRVTKNFHPVSAYRISTSRKDLSKLKITKLQFNVESSSDVRIHYFHHAKFSVFLFYFGTYIEIISHWSNIAWTRMVRSSYGSRKTHLLNKLNKLRWNSDRMPLICSVSSSFMRNLAVKCNAIVRLTCHWMYHLEATSKWVIPTYIEKWQTNSKLPFRAINSQVRPYNLLIGRLSCEEQCRDPFEWFCLSRISPIRLTHCTINKCHNKNYSLYLSKVFDSNKKQSLRCNLALNWTNWSMSHTSCSIWEFYQQIYVAFRYQCASNIKWTETNVTFFPFCFSVLTKRTFYLWNNLIFRCSK